MKTLKKLLSGMLTTIMMSTMFLVPVKAADGVQVSSTGSTVIGASSFAWSSAGDVKDNENGYDKKVATTSWGGVARTAEVTLNVEKSGTYTFDVNAVIDLALDGASPLKFSIDGGSQTTLTASNATVSELASPWTINGWTVKNVAYKNEIALKKGEHTLKFEIPMRSSGDAVIYAFDCATIKPVNIIEPVTVKSDENTIIGTSSFIWSSAGDVKDNENGYDKTIAMTDWGGVARTAEVTLNVEKAGTYSFDVNAVINLSLDGASPLKFGVDGGSQTTLTTSNATVSALSTPWTIKGWTVKNIAYKSEFVLEEGEHTLTFEIPMRSSGDAVIYAFDCATIRPTNNLATVSKAGKTTFGNSSFKWNHSGNKDSDAAYDGTYTRFNGGGATITATKSFYVEDEFEYELEVYAASSITHNALSNLEFKIDDGTSTVLKSSNSTVSDLENPCRTDSPWITKSIKYDNSISLTKGMHTITFTVPQKSNGRTEAYFVFDCASFTPAEVPEEKGPITVNPEENTTIGTSSFTWSTKSDVKDNENGYDKTIAMTDWGGVARTAEVTLNVEETGTYSFDVNAVIDLTLEGASPLKFSIDGGSQTKLTSSNTTVSALATPWTINGWTVKNISYKSDFTIEAGEHTLTFEIPMRSSGDAVIYGFDCATIRPTNNLAIVSKAGSTTFGNSSFTWNHSAVGTKDAAYDGTYTIFQGGGATIIATKSFYVEDEYEYELEVYAASSATNDALSNLEFKIDDGPSTVLNSNNSTVSELANPCRTDAPWTTKSIEYNRNIVLSKGSHTITFTIPQNSNGRTEAYFVFDCATIRSTDNSLKISGFDYDAEIAIGMTTQIVVKDNKGTVITPDMVDSITYVSSSEAVAKVDATGLVEGLSEGTTRITVTIKENDSSKPIVQTADISVSKLLISGFAIEGKIIPNNTIYAKATVGEFAGKDEVMLLALALYRGEKLEDVQFDSKVCGENTNYSASITLPEDLDNCVVKAFLWDSKLCGTYLTAKPLTNPTDFVIDINEDREPVILHISDPQIIDAKQERNPDRLYSDSESYWGSFEKMEENCFSYIREAVGETNPDLILITGDIVYGEFDDNGTSLQKFIEFMETLNTPWAPIFGNHDNESNMGADWQCAQLEAAPNCLFKQRTLTGNGNYSIGIKQNGKLNRVIYMLDSNGCSGMSQATKQNGHSKASAGFGNDQIDWYTENAKLIKEYYEDVKFTFAFHIQTSKFAAAYEKYGYSNGTPINIDYHNNKEDTDFGIIGANLKGAWDYDDSITNGMIALGADSILVGHEHANSASVVYEGVRYQYGQKCSVYDRNNYIDADGTIIYSSYSDAGDPIMGGTVMKLSKIDGTISDAYIYYCDTSDDAGEGGGVYSPIPEK